VNHAKSQQYFKRNGVDLKGTCKEFCKYKALIGSAKAQQVLKKNNE